VKENEFKLNRRNKLMRKFFLVALTLVAALTLAACNSEKKATAYGLVHGHYVGEITVEVASDGTVKTVSIEEWFLPYNWAKVTVADPANMPADVLAVVGSRGTSYYAKYVKIGDKLFTGAVSGAEGSQAITFSSRDITNIETWVEDADNAEWYVDQIKDEKFFIAKVDGTENTALVRSDANSNKAMNKSESGYWSGDNYPLGWAGNVEAMVTAFVGTKMEATAEELVKDGTWKIADVTTTATLTDFADYYLLAQVAYNDAK
jgi:hypothetical protein